MSDRFDRLESKDARKVWQEIARDLNMKFDTTRAADKVKAKIKYLIEKYKAAKDWNIKNQSGGNRRQSLFYDEIDAVLGCRDVVTLRHVTEAGSSSSSCDSSLQQDNTVETETGAEGRKGRKTKRKRAQIEEDDEERKMMEDSASGIQEQMKETREFMKTFSRTQEQQANTIIALAGALTSFLQNSNKN